MKLENEGQNSSCILIFALLCTSIWKERRFSTERQQAFPELTALSVSSWMHDLRSNFSTFQMDLLAISRLWFCIFLCGTYSEYGQSSLLWIITFLEKVSYARTMVPSDKIKITIVTAWNRRL
jgi:hypothetical protein